MSDIRQAFLGLGSNLGDRAEYLAKTRDWLANGDGTSLIKASSIYETDPVGYLEQPLFLNQVVLIETTLPPLSLLRECLAFEKKQGRERAVPNGPRTLDIDLLFIEGVELDTPALTLPHPRWRERAFVVAPLADLFAQQLLYSEPNWQRLREELENLTDRAGVRRWVG